MEARSTFEQLLKEKIVTINDLDAVQSSLAFAIPKGYVPRTTSTRLTRLPKCLDCLVPRCTSHCQSPMTWSTILRRWLLLLKNQKMSQLPLQGLQKTIYGNTLALSLLPINQSLNHHERTAENPLPISTLAARTKHHCEPVILCQRQHIYTRFSSSYSMRHRAPKLDIAMELTIHRLTATFS
jgi:hypothetical protein